MDKELIKLIKAQAYALIKLAELAEKEIKNPGSRLTITDLIFDIDLTPRCMNGFRHYVDASKITYADEINIEHFSLTRNVGKLSVLELKSELLKYNIIKK